MHRKTLANPSNPQLYYDFFDSITAFQNAKRQAGISAVRADFDPSSTGKMSKEMISLHEMNRALQPLVGEQMRKGDKIEEWFNVYRQSLLIEAPWDFEQYLLFLELDRPPKEKFYQPRMKTLRPLVRAMQDLEQDNLDELFLSLPPRTGKTTMLMFYLTWLMGKRPLRTILYSGFSDTLTRSMYNGIMQVLKDPYTYNWKLVFPNSEIVKTNAQDETINLVSKGRYPSITCRSIEGTLNGACDCDYILVADDLCSGIEEAMNKDRMLKLWQKVDNDLISRAKMNAKMLWCGTRWSLIDPIGVRLEVLKTDKTFADRRWRVINTPALNKNGESNFDYAYGVGFDTVTYKQKRASFEHNDDVASWNAQYMGEPIEREGNLFFSGEMRFFEGELPNERPDRKFMAVDPAYGGGDYTASPVCYQYGDDVYVVDAVYSAEEKDKTMPRLVRAIAYWGVDTIHFEANKAQESYVQEFKSRLKDEGIKCTILSDPAPSGKSKDQRIFDKAPNIRQNFLFRAVGDRSEEYQRFMENVFSFKAFAKNPHDDAPDSLAMAAAMVFRYEDRYAHVFRRFI